MAKKTDVLPKSSSKRSIKSSSRSYGAGELALCALDFVVRRLLCIDTKTVVIVNFAIIFGTSVAGDIARPLPSYFSNKHNIFNQYFVKLGWAWTLASVTAYMVVSNLIINQGKIRRIQRSIIKLVTMTIIWYVCTQLFEWFEEITGTCSERTHRLKNACLRGSHSWLGFDISGHVFLLTLATLFMLEEFCNITHVTKQLNELERSENPEISAQAPLLTNSLRASSYFLLYMVLLWEIMLICTGLYFHTTAQKIAAYIVAIILWFLIYKVAKL